MDWEAQELEGLKVGHCLNAAGSIWGTAQATVRLINPSIHPASARLLRLGSRPSPPSALPKPRSPVNAPPRPWGLELYLLPLRSTLLLYSGRGPFREETYMTVGITKVSINKVIDTTNMDLRKRRRHGLTGSMEKGMHLLQEEVKSLIDI